MSKLRKSISKKLRFEVFKRDGFICQYCGAHPPAVVLQVDHIVAVAVGGTNDEDNLVTSCQPCNIGKGANDLLAIPQSLQDKAADVAEREAQIRGYQSVMAARRERIEEELWIVAEEIESGSPERGMSRDWTMSIRNFLDKTGFDFALTAAQKARARYPRGGRRTFLYFCGICWNEIKGSRR